MSADAAGIPRAMPDSPSGDTAAHFVAPPGSLPLSTVDDRQAAQFHQFRHDNTLLPAAPRPGQTVTVLSASGSGVALRHAAVFYTTDRGQPSAGSHRVPMEIAAVDWEARAGYVTRWQAVLPPQPAGTVVRYRVGGWSKTPPAGAEEPEIWANDGQGFWFKYPSTAGITTFAYSVEPDAPAVPDWIRDGVIYHIFLDRFHPGTEDGVFHHDDDPRGRHGGTLEGVRKALPYLEELGVTCLWLSPLCASETYHRYDTTDLYAVDPTLGTEQDLHRLVDQAHARGMRLLLDMVPSHCSWHHSAFLEARRDPNAATRSWFSFSHWPDTYRSFLGAVPSLPSFNTDDPGARAHIIGSAVHWLREFGVDGFRLDHAIGPSMDFWVALRTAVRDLRPDAFLVGEVTDTPDCLRRYRGRLDGILDFMLARAFYLAFVTGDWDLAALDDFLGAHESFMAEAPGRVSFLDNHDMTRFLFLAGNDARRLKMAALCQFTLDAAPAIYYGTEIGMTQRLDIARGGDAEARRDMPWQEQAWNHDLLAFYRRLTRLRTGRRALRRGTRTTVLRDGRAGLYAYLRCEQDPRVDGLVSLFNLSASEQKATLPAAQMPSSPACLLSTGASPTIYARGEEVQVRLAPLTAAILGSP